MVRFNKKEIITVILLFASFFLYSQENKKELTKESQLIFTESKILDERYKVVYFCLSEVRDQDHQQEIQDVLSELDIVKKIRIYKDLNSDYRCQLTVYRDATPQYILNILKQVQTDFLYKSVKKKGFENKVNYLN